ncbi:Lecithin:cholesterol acyltransferase [Trichuris suis]|uniref:Lecithin:cholesterol acyltransferase n=1 Tax=Trichuris suis TaxID=68888 RepID=A0A085MBE0_9BILA|nr:hypothetical protein M513_04683 [Trichuris suis]KHJ45403.1 Lecithin:cholesterol acyltransferase [Trichuris suis]
MATLWLAVTTFFLVVGMSLPLPLSLKSVERLRWPVVIVPGDGGNQLEARLNKTSSVHYFCKKRTDEFFTLWLNLELLVPYVLDCWVDNMRMVYDEATGTTSNSPGVTTRIPGWGNTSTIEYIDPSKIGYGVYFADMVNAMVSWGYERGKTVRGAPYDFRRAPNHNLKFLSKLKELIENTYYSNGNKKVVTIGHSLGNLYMLYFYNTQSQSWKEKFIKSHISLAAPYGGSMKIVKAFASGYNLEQWRIVINPLTLRAEQRTMTSSAFLLPTPKVWSKEDVLVMTEKRNYTTADYKDFFNDMGYPQGWAMYKNTRDLIPNLDPPGVEVHCLYGVDVPTPEILVYHKNSFPDKQPIEVKGDGDGTVNLRSLSACRQWANNQRKPVYYRSFPKAEHTEILKNPDVLAYIKEVLFSDKP